MADDPSDGPDWAAAAARFPILAAMELLCMTRPSERVPWRRLLADQEASAVPAWGRKRPRSRGEAAKAAPPVGDEDPHATARRSSPTTPLAWSAGSASSGGFLPLSGSPKVETAASAGWGVAGPCSKEAASASRRQQGKRKMTMAELKECEASLMERTAELRKELERQRATKELLMEENARLRTLESKLLSQETRRPSSSSEAQAGRDQGLCFDLNKSPLPEDPDGVVVSTTSFF